jgi:small subunit ribosomal protein S6
VKRYEGFFLFDNTVAHEWPGVEQEVRRLCDRIGGQLQVCVKFDERKLAFEIKGRKRGTYVLTYFDAAPERIVDLERDAGLSEMILRTLVLRADKVTEERVAELQALPADTPLVPGGGDGRRYHDDYRGRRDTPGDRQRRGPAEASPEPAEKPRETAAEPKRDTPAAPADESAQSTDDTEKET